jgi:hypothetical protein
MLSFFKSLLDNFWHGNASLQQRGQRMCCTSLWSYRRHAQPHETLVVYHSEVVALMVENMENMAPM